MRLLTTFLFAIFYFASFGQDSTINVANKKHTSHRPTTFQLALGFFDYYKDQGNYNLPTGYQKNNTTGFTPVMAKLEYGLNNQFCLTFSAYYDAFVYNYSKLYSGNGITFSRYQSNDFTLLGAGLGISYYFDKYIHVKNLETFATLGFSLNNIIQSGYPQGDTTITKNQQVVSPCIKVGCRYFISKSKRSGIYFDCGFDKQSIFNLGFTSSIERGKGKHIRL